MLPSHISSADRLLADLFVLFAICLCLVGVLVVKPRLSIVFADAEALEAIKISDCESDSKIFGKEVS